MDKQYLGIEGCLNNIIDLSWHYDGCDNNIKELYELIDEIVVEAEKGLKYKEKYYVPCFTRNEIIKMLKDK